MNTNAIFFSSAHMYRELREACHDGLTRIEISYSVEGLDQEKLLLHEGFHTTAAIELDLVQEALQEMDGLGVQMPMQKLYEAFQQQAKGRQLYVQMKHTAALIYAANDKAGCFTGLVRDIPKNGCFNYLDFIAANALPGPYSKINCIIQRDGPGGESVMFSLTKATSLSQIPGLVYRGPPVSSLPRP